MQPEISILMNCFNGERYLREALDSILNQTYSNWELIFWDNQSTDNSAAIVKGYNDSRIKYYYSPEHTVLGKARNLALKKVRGEWLAFLDVDDLWMPDKLEKQVSLINRDETDLGFVYGRSEIFYETGSKKSFVFKKGERLPEGYIFKELAKNNFIPFLSGLVNMNKFIQIGGFPEDFKNSTDYYMYLHLAYRYPVRAVQDVCCRYRIHEKNLSHSQRIIGNNECIRVVSEFLPDKHAKEGIRYHYADLAIAYLKDHKYADMFKIIVKHNCFIIIIRRIISAVIRRINNKGVPAEL